MEHHAPAGPAPLLEDPDAVVPRVAAVHDDGEVAPAGDGDLGPEGPVLLLVRRRVPVVVDARLSNGHDPWCCREQVRYLKVGPANRSMYERAKTDWPPVVHPLVYVQEQTGRKALNLSPRFARSILGIPKHRSDELLTLLSNHLWDSPSYHHKWSEGEMVLWDNWRMLHRVTPAPFEEVRIVERTTLDGDYGLGRKLEAVA